MNDTVPVSMPLHRRPDRPLAGFGMRLEQSCALALALLLAFSGCGAETAETAATPPAADPPRDATATDSAAANPAGIDAPQRPRLEGEPKPLRIVVMDPLAGPLSCACVPGLGQRRYGDLGEYLTPRLGRPVEVVYDESLGLAYQRVGRDVELIVGERSVVEYDARRTETVLRPVAALTDLHGKASVRGAVLVPKGHPAGSVAELSGCRLMLAPEEYASSHAAVLELLERERLREDVPTATAGSIEEGVFAVTDGDAAAAVVPEFMPRLLEGCGKVAPGSLRVVGLTAPVPFVTVFATASLTDEDEQTIREALAGVSRDAELLKALESKAGFELIRPGEDLDKTLALADRPAADPSAERAERIERGWTDWRGPNRDGHSGSVPRRLPERLEEIWSAKVTGPALAGIAATERFVVVPDKDRDLTRDVFRCFDARTGESVWTLEYPAAAEIEYTNAPRATPVIHEGLVYLQGALGDLHCVRLATGEVVWTTNIVTRFGAEPLNWGSSSPPLVVDDLLIVNPGAKEASLAAFDRKTGEVVWRTPGHAAAYSAFVLGTFSGVRQVVGYDAAGLGGWDPKTGRRLWELIPPDRSDFNVGMPVIVGERLLVATENNATRLYAFDGEGRIKPEPVAQNEDLAPDTCTPVVLDGRAFGTAYGELYCLDLNDDLRTVWVAPADEFYDHVNLIAGNGRVMLWTTTGDLLLVRADTQRYEPAGRVRPFEGDEVETMSHPAIVGDRLYVRDSTALKCLRLPPAPQQRPH